MLEPNVATAEVSGSGDKRRYLSQSGKGGGYWRVLSFEFQTINRRC